MDIKVIDPFLHPPAPDPNKPQPNYGNHGVFDNVLALHVGRGNIGFHVTKEGMWLGHQKISQAPFAVTPQGLASFRDELGQTIVDASGLKSDTQFLSSTIEDFTDRTTALATPQDVAGTSLTFTVPRFTNVHIPISVTSYISGLTGGDAGAAPTGIVQLKIDGVLSSFKIRSKVMRQYTPETTGLTVSGDCTQSYAKLIQLAPGKHTISLVMYLLAASSYTLHVTETSVTYVTLGK